MEEATGMRQKKTPSSEHRDVIERLLEGERRAKARVEEARKEADQIVDSAKKDAEAEVDQAEKGARKEADEMIAGAEDASQTSAAASVKDVDALRRHAHENMASAVTTLVDWVAGKTE